MTSAGAGAGEGEASAAGPSQVVMVRRDLLAKCMTCPLCLKLLRDATTIIECLHTCEFLPSSSPPPLDRKLPSFRVS
ncbi:hypothetical protein BHE74_00043712 [Ensete ventricosum]|nr:hypothetical protein GW17_00005328 [Ensete ventricosum]RWW50052.1 hypothetical protein BHE74_00043712 [Ensete ventricosum]